MSLINFIPEKYEEGFTKIALVDDDYFGAIKEGLLYSSLVSSIGLLIKKIAEYKHLEPDDLRKIFISVGSLTPYLDGEAVIKQLVDDIAKTAIETTLIEANSKQKFIERLSFLLSNKNIYYASREWVVNRTSQEDLHSTEKLFNNLAINWKKETAGYSTMYHKAINNNYLGIIGMGYDAVPFILNDLEKAPEHWFIALKAITKENPVAKEDIGDMRRMRAAWIEWGKRKHII